MALSATMRTLDQLKKMNRLSGIVERFIHNRRVNHAGGIRSDLFGIIDIIALCPKDGIVGIQSCNQHYSEHYKKITIEKKENTKAWLIAGGKLEIWSWRKVLAKRGCKQKVWKPIVTKITLENLKEGNGI